MESRETSSTSAVRVELMATREESGETRLDTTDRILEDKQIMALRKQV